MVGERICNACEEIKPLESFHKAKKGPFGRYSICKQCKNQKTVTYFSTAQGKAARVRANKTYYNTDKGKIQKAKDQEIYIKKYPDKHLGHRAVSYAVEFGYLPHISNRICISCGKRAEHYHHHKGYSKAFKLDVIPLCHKCHMLA